MINTKVSDSLRSHSVPSMKGTASRIALINVWLDIFGVTFDLSTLTVEKMDVRVSTGIFGIKTGLFKSVASDDEVNQIFRDSANAKIKEGLGDLTSSPGLALLNSLTSNVDDQKLIEKTISTEITSLQCKELLKAF